MRKIIFLVDAAGVIGAMFISIPLVSLGPQQTHATPVAVGWLMLGAGFIGLAVAMRRRRK
jgi:hypothetical protein